MIRLQVLLFVSLAACGEIKVASTPLGATGDSCTKAADCASPNRCVANVCQVPAEPVSDGGDGVTDGTVDSAGGAEAVDAADGADSGAVVDPANPCGLGECAAGWLDDGVCEKECNCEALAFDNGSCQNLCTSPDNTAVWKVDGFPPIPGACWQQCADAGDPELQTCTATCLQTNGLAVECSTCFAAYTDCMAANCDPSCLPTPGTPDCETCSTTYCWQAFYNCSGAI